MVALALFWALAAAAQPPVADAAALRAEVEVEHLWPTHADREIETSSCHLLVGRWLLHVPWLAWRAGLTTTYADGFIVQLDDRLRSVRFDTAAVGAGPVVALRLQTPEFAHLVLGAEGSGGVVLYSQRFPAGGDVYNFMWRAGLQIEYHAGDAWWLGAGYRVMHVSNGQGLGPQNPSYEARGVSAWFAWTLR